MAGEVLYRSFAPDLSVRSDGGQRTVYGIAVPYNHRQKITDSLTESFAPGAFNAVIRSAHRVPYARDHLGQGGTLIGRLTELRDDPAGLYFEARVSPTVAGDETLALIRDGALDQHSIGFRERQSRRLDDGTVQRVTADLRELAVVMEGAYGPRAAAMGVRSADAPSCSGADVVARILAALPVLPAL